MFADLTYLQLAWIVFAAFAAYLIRGMSGFGAGLIAVPLMALALPVRTVIPTTAMLVFLLFVFLTIRDRRDVVWPELKRLALPTIGGVAAGVVLFRVLDNHLLVILLGCFLILFATYMVVVNMLGLPELRFSPRAALPLGFAGSFFDTLFGGGGGTLVVIYMHSREVSRVQFRATLAMLWLLEMLARIFGYAVEGYYTARVVMLIALLLPVMLLASWIGEHFGNRVSKETFSRILAGLLLLSGVSLLLK